MRVFLLVLFKVRTSIKTGNSHFFKFLCQIKSKLIQLNLKGNSEGTSKIKLRLPQDSADVLPINLFALHITVSNARYFSYF
ncbi:hypothetical protein CAB17_04480 [Legionella sainthelensi]|uniref:Uncharacterized protein n=1 Tax=Legionella sainthelensi TaxID=28087 RepID=A0A2H5FIP1_9GAMM|nr:hypothetical protein CAB17_04480 [Legionella sainthelensi]